MQVLVDTWTVVSFPIGGTDSMSVPNMDKVLELHLVEEE